MYAWKVLGGGRGIRGPNLSPRNHQPAVETTAGQQNPTCVGLEEKINKSKVIWFCSFFNPTKVGFRALAVVSTARHWLVREPHLSVHPRREFGSTCISRYCSALLYNTGCLLLIHPHSPRESGRGESRHARGGRCRTTRQYTQTNRNRRCSCFSRHCCWRTCRCKRPQTRRRWGC